MVHVTVILANDSLFAIYSSVGPHHHSNNPWSHGHIAENQSPKHGRALLVLTVTVTVPRRIYAPTFD